MDNSNYAFLEAAADAVKSKEPSETENNSGPAEPSEMEDGGAVEEFPETRSVRQPAEDIESGNILIAYFSRYGNTEYSDDVDATTAASIVADKTGRYGTTEYVANMIQQAVGGDIHRIETVTPYTFSLAQ